MREPEGDPRHYLPSNVPLITPERAAKGDVLTGPPCRDCNATGKVKADIGKAATAPCKACKGRGWIGSVNASTIAASDIRFAQIHEVNVLNCLWDRELITDQQHHDGQTFQIWRDMHHAQMGLQKPVSSGGEESFGVRLRSYGYIFLIRHLNRHDFQAIETTLQPMSMSWAEWLSRNRSEKYITALDRLSMLLPPIKDQISYLEGLDEIEREALSREGIQKMFEDCKDDEPGKRAIKKYVAYIKNH